MKTKKKIGFNGLIFAMSIVIFLGAIFMCVGILLGQDSRECRSFLAKDGLTRVTATVVSREGTNSYINDTQLYTIQYTYIGADGNEHEGQTSGNFYYSETRIDTIDIVYDSEYNSMEADYNDRTVIFLRVFLNIGLGLLLIGIVGMAIPIVKAVRRAIYLKDAVLVEGLYAGMHSTLRVNGRPIFSIKYEYDDPISGEHCEAKTAMVYTREGAMEFERAKRLKVLVGKHNVSKLVDDNLQ